MSKKSVQLVSSVLMCAVYALICLGAVMSIYFIIAGCNG